MAEDGMRSYAAASCRGSETGLIAYAHGGKHSHSPCRRHMGESDVPRPSSSEKQCLNAPDPRSVAVRGEGGQRPDWQELGDQSFWQDR
jgi:hypothetical protein